MSEIVTWRTSNGVKVCNRWPDSDAPRAATIIAFGNEVAVLAPAGTVLVNADIAGAARWNCRAVFPHQPKDGTK